MWCAKEEDAIGAGKDVVVMGHLGSCPRLRKRKCLCFQGIDVRYIRRCVTRNRDLADTFYDDTTKGVTKENDGLVGHSGPLLVGLWSAGSADVRLAGHLGEVNLRER